MTCKLKNQQIFFAFPESSLFFNYNAPGEIPKNKNSDKTMIIMTTYQMRNSPKLSGYKSTIDNCTSLFLAHVKF